MFEKHSLKPSRFGTSQGVTLLRASKRSRRPSFEALEGRILLAADIQNAYQRFDVNLDLNVNPQDALQVINQVSRANRGNDSVREGLFPDVNGDGKVTPRDALQVINQLVRRRPTVAARLATDTAPGGTTNFDRVTSTYGLDAKIANSAAGLELRVNGTNEIDFVDLSGMVIGQTVRLSDAQIETLFPGKVNRDSGRIAAAPSHTTVACRSALGGSS